MLLKRHPKLPGVAFSKLPQQETITPEGREINLEEEIGASISVPKEAVLEDKHIQITSSLSGSFLLPDDVESVSPSYLIKTTKKMEFSKEVDVRLQHTANLETEEDCKDMVFLKASLSPRDSGSKAGPVYKFEEIKEKEVEFSPGKRRFGMIKLKQLFSWFKIGRKKKESKSTSTRQGRKIYDAVYTVTLIS